MDNIHVAEVEGVPGVLSGLLNHFSILFAVARGLFWERVERESEREYLQGNYGGVEA